MGVVATADFCCQRRPGSVFAAQMREQNHVTDVGRVGDQHHQAIDADAAAAGRRHAVFQRADIVGVEIHRFFITGILGCNLRLKAGGLVFRVVQLGEAVGDFAAGDKQFETCRRRAPAATLRPDNR